MNFHLGDLGRAVGSFLGRQETGRDSRFPTGRGKRKARDELRCRSQIHRASNHPRPHFTDDDYATSNFWEGAAERRTSYAGLVTDSACTTLLESGTESEPEPLRHFSVFNEGCHQSSKLPNPAQTAEAEDVREKRLAFFELGKQVTGAVDAIQDFIDQKANVVERPVLEHAKDDIIHARVDIEHARVDGEEPRIRHDRGDAQLEQDSIQEEQQWPERVSHEGPALPISAYASSSRPGSKGLEQWKTAPNNRARRIIQRTPDLSSAALQIKAELCEPEYSYRDVEIRDTMWQIMDKIELFAKEFFGGGFPRNKKKLEEAFTELEPETIKIIGCVASGGPGGPDGWRELFWDEQKRRALVCAIIGNVLVEQVFQHFCFGADEVTLKELANIQEELKDEDGFARNTAFANHLRSILYSNSSDSNPLSNATLRLPPNFALHISTIVHAISTHLAPLFSIIPTYQFPPPDTWNDSLISLITFAGILSLQMRTDPHTVYYHTPVFKEDTFKSQYMEAFNRKRMESTHPRGPSTAWPPNTSEAEKKRARGDEPLTQITIMDGVTAYRKGGWETADSTVAEPVYAAQGGEERGIRARILVHGWVYCRWGRPRVFENGKPKDDPKLHGEAWKAPGFVEFRELPGVGRRNEGEP